MAHLYTGDTVDLLARPDIAAIFFIRISGIPYLWGSDALPADWGSGGAASLLGDTYTWSPRLVVGASFGAISTKTEPKAGVGVTGGQTFEISITGSDDAASDPMLSLLVKDLHRADKAATNLSQTLSDTSTTSLFVDSTVGFANAGVAYVGLETIAYANRYAGYFGALTRGKHGSWAEEHRFVGAASADDSETASGGAFVADWPLLWAGRSVELYMGFGVWQGGEFTPFEDAGGSPILQQIYRGILTGIDESGDTLTTAIQTAALEQVLGYDVATRLPTAQVLTWSEDRPMGTFYVGDHNRWLSWVWEYNDAAHTLLGPYVRYPLRVTAAGAEVSEGLYDKEQIKIFIMETIKKETMPTAYGGTYSHVYISQYWDPDHPETGPGSGADFRYNIVMTFPANSTTGSAKLRLITGEGYGLTILRDFGYTDDVVADIALSGTSTSYRGEFEAAQEAPPAWYCPTRAFGLGRVYYESPSALAFNSNPGWTADDGSIIYGMIAIDDKVLLSFSGGSTTTLNGETFSYLTIKKVYLYPTEPYVIKYDPGQTKGGKVTQGLGFYDISIGRALAYLLTAGGPATTYGGGWSGSGLALPESMLNLSELLSIGEQTQLRDLIWIDKPTPVRKVIAPEVQFEQVLLIAVADWDAGTGPQITMLPTYPPGESLVADSAIILNESNLHLLGGGDIGLDRDEAKIINIAAIKIGVNPLTRKEKSIFNQTQETSIQTWGPKPAISLTVASLGLWGSPSALQAHAKDLAQILFDRYSYPYEIWELDVATPKSWSYRIGDVVSITSDHLPSITEPGRGVSAMAGMIYRKQDFFTGGQGVASRLTIVARESLGERRSTWAPSMYLTHYSGSTWTVTPHEYSDSGDADDITHFAVNDYVRLAAVEATTGGTYRISSIDLVNGRVVIAFGPPSSYHYQAASIAYSSSSVNAAQKRHVALSDGDGILNLNAGSDQAYVYGG